MEHFVDWFAKSWPYALVVDIRRYIIFAVTVWLVLWVFGAGLLRSRKIREVSPPWQQLTIEFLISLRTTVIFSTLWLATLALGRFGWIRGPSLAASWGPLWFWVSLVLMILAHDTYFYWTHRIVHHPRLFRSFHRRHHRSSNPSPFTAYSFDIAEAIVLGTFLPLWMIVIPTPWAVVGLFMLHQITRNTLAHAGYELSPASRDGRPLFDWLTTPTHHDLHHEQAGGNYSLYFTWWDRWMGTENPEYYVRFAAAVRKPLFPASNPASNLASKIVS